MYNDNKKILKVRALSSRIMFCEFGHSKNRAVSRNLNSSNYKYDLANNLVLLEFLRDFWCFFLEYRTGTIKVDGWFQ